jgi:hypothetical protein
VSGAQRLLVAAMAAAIVGSAGSACASSGGAGGELTTIPAGRWRVTKGRLAGSSGPRGQVTEAKFRAVAPGSDGNAAELRFVYQGPTAETTALASGEVRRQLGIKLRAENGCNLLYVMWRFEPKSQVVVSVKANPGQRTHRECGARGYRNLKSKVAAAAAVPAPAPGSAHAMKAVLTGTMLRVWLDHALVWEGDVGAEGLASAGPVGLRSDNVRFEAELQAHPGAATAAAANAPGDADDED